MLESKQVVRKSDSRGIAKGLNSGGSIWVHVPGWFVLGRCQPLHWPQSTSRTQNHSLRVKLLSDEIYRKLLKMPLLFLLIGRFDDVVVV